MATIKVKGNEAEITLFEEPRGEETAYRLKCDRGAWCPSEDYFSDPDNWQYNIADAIAEAEIHVDMVDHS